MIVRSNEFGVRRLRNRLKRLKRSDKLSFPPRIWVRGKLHRESNFFIKINIRNQMDKGLFIYG
jgi:hypothetical protein